MFQLHHIKQQRLLIDTETRLVKNGEGPDLDLPICS